MENEIIMGAFGLIIGYFIFKFITRKQKNSTNLCSDMSELQSNSEHTEKFAERISGVPEKQSFSQDAQKSKNSKEFLGHENQKDFHKSTISDILTSDKYKVKGQWDK